MPTSVNPATDEIIARYEPHTDEELDAALETATSAFDVWEVRPLEERTAVLIRTAQLLRERADELARLMTAEMGKPVTQAKAEAEKCAWVCEYYAEHAASFLEPEVIETDASTSYVAFQPLGPIFAVMPWNFPLWQVFRFAAPNLAAGNVGLLKHAANVTGCAIAIEELFRDAGAPAGVFQTLVIDHDQSTSVITDRRVRGVTLTGSVPAGRAVAKLAAESLKPTVLELGGSDPFVVLADCDLAKTLDGAITGRTQNNGQSCIAAKRFIVEKPVYEEFCKRFGERMEALVVGDPMAESTDVGPLAQTRFVGELNDQVERTLAAGGRLITGGERGEQGPCFYMPTVVADVTPGMAMFDEETFGPAAAVICADDIDDAIRLANLSDFGLGATIWTERENPGELAAKIDAGHVAVNGIVKSDPRLPFGGIKDSGYGRELSRHGFVEFLNKKTVWIG